jgi:hypothetical protein
LREEIGLRMKSGLNEAEAFQTAVQQIGPAGLVQKEFRKKRHDKLAERLILAATTSCAVFVGGGFLSSYQGFQNSRLDSGCPAWRRRSFLCSSFGEDGSVIKCFQSSVPGKSEIPFTFSAALGWSFGSPPVSVSSRRITISPSAGCWWLFFG